MEILGKYSNYYLLEKNNISLKIVKMAFWWERFDVIKFPFLKINCELDTCHPGNQELENSIEISKSKYIENFKFSKKK